MVKKHKKWLLLLLSILIIISSIVPNILAYDWWTWENDDHLLAASGANNFHQHCTIMLDNGSILCAHYDYPAHSDGGNISTHVSHDNGTTWVSGSMLWDVTAETYGAVCCGLGIAPNGTAVAMVQTRTPGATTNYYGLWLKHSYDNAITWVDKGWVNTTDPNATRHITSQIITVGNTMYAPTFTDTPQNIFNIYSSIDNGSTWTNISQVYSTATTAGYVTLVQMANGSFLWMNYYDNTYNMYSISSDDCVTWTTPTDSGTNIRDVDINVMYEDNGTARYFVHGRDLDYGAGHFGFWFSNDGLTWQNHTDVDSGSTRMAYSSGCAVGDDLLLTYSYNGDMCDLRYTWVFNVTNTTSGSGSSNSFYFLSIDGQGNESEITNMTPTFNWTRNETEVGMGKYWLQIANDSAFTDICRNVTGISELSYPAEFSQNSTRVSFILPGSYALTHSGTYYCRVRAAYIPGWT